MPYHKDDNCKECKEAREELYRREHEYARREKIYEERYPSIIDLENLGTED